MKKVNLKKIGVGVLVFLAILIGLRLYLPFWVTDYVNKTLSEIEGYQGSIEGVDIDLYRGAYGIRGLELDKTGEEIPVPFVDISRIDLSVQWKALLHGSIVGEIELMEPTLNFTADSAEITQSGTDTDWTEPIQELIPLEINRFAIINGTITYKDFGSTPKVELVLDSLQAEALNLRNITGKEGTLPSTINAKAKSIGGGTLDLSSKANIIKEVPDFDLTAQLENVDLIALNDFSKAYANLDFEKGVFNVYTEIAVANSKMEGYVKPVLNDITVFDLGNEDGNILQQAWEAISGFVITIFSNQVRDQFATEVPFEGDLSNPDTKIWTTIGGVLRNAFIKGFSKSTDDSVDFEDVIE
ncbi:MAG: DUF748 domain-containing protein [Balneola sp.]